MDCREGGERHGWPCCPLPSSRLSLSFLLQAAAGRARVAEADKDVLVAKLTDDLGKVMGELQRVQGDLHRAQARKGGGEEGRRDTVAASCCCTPLFHLPPS